MEEIQSGIFRQGGSFYTRNRVPGTDVYGEKLVDVEGVSYRRWSPSRSKACSALHNKLELGIEPGHEILYLGAATGTTVSHFSDILEEGFIVAVECSEEPARKLVKMAESRENIAPAIADARKPGEYSEFVEQPDIIYQDISQRDQVKILERNAERYLETGKKALVALKARSISSTDSIYKVFREAKQELGETFEIVDEAELDPYHPDHLFLVLEKK